ncbi:hypothetical protein SNE40_015459 [Patella caerulea]|uniref:C2H2-type domain-containing protein n=1 Tax=Patella caerulea TaxID=87958 RepID=A0AAN8JI10_PATCE
MAASMEGSSEKPVLEALHLKDLNEPVFVQNNTGKMGDRCEQNPCLLCEEVMDKKDELLAHLVMEHKFVIADVNLISNFQRYIKYWKKRLKEQPVTDFCSVIVTNTDVKDEDPKEEFYLLCDVLPEDKDLRQFLQKQKLEEVLASQQKEREDTTFSRPCLFCKEHFTGNRSEMINHMASDHSFNVGLPDNIVYTNEFLDELQFMLDNLKCLYCEKTFKDKTSLKEHMRKKQHRKIKANNRKYDKYYVINYLELGKNWEEIQSEEDYHNTDDDVDDENENEEGDWYNWKEESGAQAVCLFCEFSSSHPDRLKAHMQELHDFDLHELKLKMNLNFYQKVKLINYIRRQVYQCLCYGCHEELEDKQMLLDHMHTTGHTSKIPPVSVWDQPQYYFPTYENDNLLCQLEDDEEGLDDEDATVPIIAEDVPITHTTSIVTDELRQELLLS